MLENSGAGNHMVSEGLYKAVLRTLRWGRLITMLISLGLVIYSAVSNQATEDRLVTITQAIFTLLFGIAMSQWQHSWERRYAEQEVS